MASRRSVMTLFSAPDEPQSHRVRIVLAEKANEIDIVSVVPGRYPGGPARPQSLPEPADPGRSRPGALRRARHHRLPGRALSAPAADAGRSGVARAVPPGDVPRRARLVRTGRADRTRERPQEPGAAQEGTARHHARERRPVQDQAVLPERRVLGRRRDHRADALAHAPLRDRVAAAGAGDGQVRGHDPGASVDAREPFRRRDSRWVVGW